MRHITEIIEIAAPVEAVWNILIDTDAYPDWNPFIIRLEGQLLRGERLEVRIKPPGANAMTFRPHLTDVVEHQRLEWLGHLAIRGLFDGRHAFTLEQLPDGGTRFTQSEAFGGMLVPLLGGTLRKTQAGFAAMNQALRERAELPSRSGQP